MKRNTPTALTEELLIRVDEYDRLLGYDSKEACHQGNGLLHRAFSIFVLNEHNHILLQQRSSQKPLWPLYWSNSVCSHPRKGETYARATQRRLQEELGLTVSLQLLFKFRYQAQFNDVGSEHELCAVYLGKINGIRIQANPDEIADWTFVPPHDLTCELQERPERYTPWLQMEWQRIIQLHAEYLS